MLSWRRSPLTLGELSPGRLRSNRVAAKLGLKSKSISLKNQRSLLPLEVLMICSYCSNKEFHASRLRLSDLFQLLIFRLPVRCAHCQFRQFEPALQVRNYMKMRKQQRKAA
jgi:hypothetical protein